MSLQDIFGTVRGTDRATPASSPDSVLLAHTNKLHAQWQHERFGDIMQVRAALELDDTPPTVVENFRARFNISELNWVFVDGIGALTRRASEFNRPYRYLHSQRYFDDESFYTVEGGTLTVHACGPAEVRGQARLPMLMESDIPTHINPLLEAHPNLYISGLLYQEAVSTRADPNQVALAAGAYNAALEGVRSSERDQLVKLP